MEHDEPDRRPDESTRQRLASHPRDFLARTSDWLEQRPALFSLLLVLLIVILCHVGVTVYARMALKAKLAELEASGVPITWEGALRPRVAQADNAADLYMRAHALAFPERPSPSNRWRSDDPYSEFDPDGAVSGAAARQALAADAEALQLIDKAVQRPVAQFDIEWEKGYEALFPQFSKMRALARMVNASAVVASRDGDQATALRRLRQSTVMAHHVAGEEVTIAQLVAYAMVAMTRRAATDVLARNDIPEPEARGLASALERTDRFRLDQAIEWERVMAIDLFPRLRKDPGLLGTADDRVLGIISPAAGVWLARNAVPFILDANEMCYLTLMDQTAASATEPWRVLARRLSAGGGAHAAIPKWASVTQQLAMHTDPLAHRRDEAIATCDTVRTVLGLQVYRGRFGGYPERLEQLSRIDWDVPEDVFSGKPLVYRRKGNRFVLYSIGTDLIDDGERPLAKLTGDTASSRSARVGGLEVPGGDIAWVWPDERVRQHSASGQP